MKLGIIGLPKSGKSTIFEALTKNIVDAKHKKDTNVAVVRVPDKRLKILSDVYKPQKTVFAQVQYFLPDIKFSKTGNAIESNSLGSIRNCDALIHIVGNFTGYGCDKPNPRNNLINLEQELIITDLVVVEKRLERLELEKKRNRKINEAEFNLLLECLKTLENDIPLRSCPDIALSEQLKGYGFISAKPKLILLNNDDFDNTFSNIKDDSLFKNCLIIQGKLEHEISQMTDDEAIDFLKEFNIKSTAMNRVIKKSYELLGLISFFTVGEDEVRAWTIKNNTQAVEAAKTIHSDIQKGFIRAEVISYNDFINSDSSYSTARKKGCVRLEGKTYEVQDGDIINFRFNV